MSRSWVATAPGKGCRLRAPFFSTVPAGTHTFAGQYNHAQGDRDAGRDDYTARARVAGEQVAVGGDFTQTR
ncbi:hypothetical protein [Streptomyces sp. wa22]|uniref:hypothetical protein n=1 Tax=Streptomyces sp. wa22 TaxID=1828244 RepID=UPI0011C9C855|nr:hypothetical protein [Streptomyces sp. wa22]TXS07037.1 hypothetical protein EAO68_38930 [Streptomyces sp. wa22]